MRIVRNFKTALSRQIGEAVRIRRRGGAGMILNSKYEYNLCKIPRLVLEELDEDQIRADEEEEMRKAIEWSNKCEKELEESRTADREQELRKARRKLCRLEEKIASRKMEQEQNKEDLGDRRKKLKYEVNREDMYR